MSGNSTQVRRLRSPQTSALTIIVPDIVGTAQNTIPPRNSPPMQIEKQGQQVLFFDF